MSNKRVATTRPDHRRGMTKGQIRAERRAKSNARRRRRRTVIIAGVSLLAILLVGSLLVGPGLRRDNQGSGVAPQAFNSAGPAAMTQNDGRGHIPVGASRPTYSTIPATSGPHWVTPPGTNGAPLGAPVQWGIYEQVIPDEALVHNLEHGGIGIHYDCPDSCPEILEDLQQIMPSNKFQIVMSPYRRLPSLIALTAWQHVIYLENVDEDKIRDFIEAYQNRAFEPGTYPF